MGVVLSDSKTSPAGVYGRAFHAVPLVRFVVFAFLSWGLYDIYWIYRNARSRGGPDAGRLACIVKAVFAGISFAFLAADVERERGRSVAQGFVLGGLYLALILTQKLPEPWWLLFHLRVLPLAVTAGSLAKVTPPSAQPLKAWQVVLCVFGGLFTFLGFLGGLFPELGADAGSEVSAG